VRYHHIAPFGQNRGKDPSDASEQVKPFHLLRVRGGIVRDIPGSAWSAAITDFPLKTVSFLGFCHSQKSTGHAFKSRRGHYIPQGFFGRHRKGFTFSDFGSGNLCRWSAQEPELIFGSVPQEPPIPLLDHRDCASA